MQKKLDLLNVMIKDCDNIVCLAGMGLVDESHYPNHRSSAHAYETEKKYGYSPEELLSTRFYNTRPEQFYEYYRNEMLQEGEPWCAFYALKNLEQRGKLKALVTRSVHGIARKVGCQNVLELHGNVHRNFCPRCKREYSVEYLKNYKDMVPVCEQCGVTIHPGLSLMGEMIDNSLMTTAINAVENADLLLVLGCDMTSSLTTNLVKYYRGDKLVLINEKHHYLDEKADLVIHGSPSQILSKTV